MSDLKTVNYDSPIGIISIFVREGKLENISLLLKDKGIDNGILHPSGSSEEAPFAEVIEFLNRYFAGESVQWIIRHLPSGSEFQRKVWKILADIPFGTTVSYGELAAMAGRPGAARAVGSAMARNPLPILIPCHRVIAANGKLGGYGGGLDMKKWLLRHEGINI